MRVLWFFGTAVLALGALAFAARDFVTRRNESGRFLRPALAGVIGLAAVVANPIFNMVAFSAVAERYRAEMFEDAKNSECVGRTTEWLKARYGRPHEVQRDEHDAAIEHWWYAPGPWFLVHEDYIGFTVKDGLVSSTYVQVN